MLGKEKILDEIFKSTPSPDALRFTLTLDGYEVNVAIKKKKEKSKCIRCANNCKCNKGE